MNKTRKNRRFFRRQVGTSTGKRSILFGIELLRIPIGFVVKLFLSSVNIICIISLAFQKWRKSVFFRRHSVSLQVCKLYILGFRDALQKQNHTKKMLIFMSDIHNFFIFRSLRPDSHLFCHNLVILFKNKQKTVRSYNII